MVYYVYSKNKSNLMINIKKCDSFWMGGKSFKQLILSPFTETQLAPPELYTPFSTIKIPSLFICMLIVSISFLFIAGGQIYCWVQNMPFMPTIMGENGQPKVIIFHPEVSGQVGAEGFVASGVYLLTSLSLIAGVYSLKFGTKKNTQEDEILETLITIFAYTSPLWVFMSVLVFRGKVPSYLPRPI